MNDLQTRHVERTQDVSILDVIALCWKRKAVIAGVTFAFALATALFALSKPNIYRAVAVVKPEIDANAQNPLARRFGGLASIARFRFNRNQDDPSVLILETLESWEFLESVIEKHDLGIELMAAKSWDSKTGKLVINPKLYDVDKAKWLTENKDGEVVKPSLWRMYDNFSKKLVVVQDEETGIIRISIKHKSPIIAKKWVDLIIDELNLKLRAKAIEEANKNIHFLKEQIDKTTVNDVQVVLYDIIRDEMQKLMLAEANTEYALKTIVPARIPDKYDRYSPHRKKIVIMGALLGLLLSLVVVVVSEVGRKYRLQPDNDCAKD
jgi:uncharacterized protein involved in exopolysaccharide biosynthesis